MIPQIVKLAIGTGSAGASPCPPDESPSVDDGGVAAALSPPVEPVRTVVSLSVDVATFSTLFVAVTFLASESFLAEALAAGFFVGFFAGFLAALLAATFPAAFSTGLFPSFLASFFAGFLAGFFALLFTIAFFFPAAMSRDGTG